jgi:large-conductance mechanosensitive channel
LLRKKEEEKTPALPHEEILLMEIRDILKEKFHPDKPL